MRARTLARRSVFWKRARTSCLASSGVNSWANGPLPWAHRSWISCRLAPRTTMSSENFPHSLTHRNTSPGPGSSSPSTWRKGTHLSAVHHWQTIFLLYYFKLLLYADTCSLKLPQRNSQWKVFPFVPVQAPHPKIPYIYTFQYTQPSLSQIQLDFTVKIHAPDCIESSWTTFRTYRYGNCNDSLLGNG